MADKVADTDGAGEGVRVADKKVRHPSVARRNAARLAAIQTLYQHRFANTPADQEDTKPKPQSLTETMADYEAHFLPTLLESLGIPHLHTDMRQSHYRRLLLGLAGEAGELASQEGDASQEGGGLASEVDGVIGGYLGEGWRLERLPALEVDTLRLAVFELQACADIPARAIIAEYAAIAAEAWGADPRYVTAVLDKIAHKMRPLEMGEEAGKVGEGDEEGLDEITHETKPLEMEEVAKPLEMGEGMGGEEKEEEATTGEGEGEEAKPLEMGEGTGGEEGEAMPKEMGEETGGIASEGEAGVKVATGEGAVEEEAKPLEMGEGMGGEGEAGVKVATGEGTGEIASKGEAGAVATTGEGKEEEAKPLEMGEVATTGEGKEEVATTGEGKEEVATTGEGKEEVATTGEEKEEVATGEGE